MEISLSPSQQTSISDDLIDANLTGDQMIALEKMRAIRNLEPIMTALVQRNADLQRNYKQLLDDVKRKRDERARILETRRISRAESAMKRNVARLQGMIEKISVHFEKSVKELESLDSSEAVIVAGIIRDVDVLLDKEGMRSDAEVMDLIPRVDRLSRNLMAATNQRMSHGLKLQLPAELSESLEVYYCLGKLTIRVNKIIDTLASELDKEAKRLLDYSHIQRQNKGDTKAAIWKNLEALQDQIVDQLSKIIRLENVMKSRHDSSIKMTYQELFVIEMDETPTAIMWKRCTACFVRELSSLVRSSPTFVQPFIESEYPRLSSFVRSIISRIASVQRLSVDEIIKRPEAAFMLQGVSGYKNGYLKRFKVTCMEFATRAVDLRGSASLAEITKIVKTFMQELENTQADSELQKDMNDAFSRIIMDTAALFKTKLNNPEGFKIGQGICTPMQQSNIDIADTVGTLRLRLEEEVASGNDALNAPLEKLLEVEHAVIEPMVKCFRETLSSVLLKIHNQSFSGVSTTSNETCSPYMHDFGRKLLHLNTEFISRLSIKNQSQKWSIQLCRDLLGTFLRQASVVSPIDDPGRMRLAMDMTQLEFFISQVATSHKWTLLDLGERYKGLRAFRPLLFVDVFDIRDACLRDGISNVVMIHQLLIRGHDLYPLLISSPHEMKKASRQEYAAWLEQTSEVDIVSTIKEVVKNLKVSDPKASKIISDVLK